MKKETIMKKIYIIMFLCLGTLQGIMAQIPIDPAHFPCANLREELLRDKYDIDEDKMLSASEIASIWFLCVYDLTSTEGLEYLTALTDLELPFLQIASLNFSNLPNLRGLSIRDSSVLTSLNVSENQHLEDLYIWRYNSDTNTPLTSLNLTPSLKKLWLTHCNLLTKLDLTICTALKEINLEGLDATTTLILNCNELEEFHCSAIPISELDLSNYSSLQYIYCGFNSQLEKITICGCPELKLISCNGNEQLTSLIITDCVNINEIECQNNQLTALNVSGCTALNNLSCYANQLTSLNVSGCTALENLSCYGNQLTSLNVSGCTALGDLYCYGNQLTSLDVSGCTALENLHCYGNQIGEAEMGNILNSLPEVTSIGWLLAIDTANETEQNVINTVQVRRANEKGWQVYDYRGDWSNRVLYMGTVPTNGDSDMEPIEVVCTITFTDGNLENIVIDNIYYNLKGEDGYDATNQCIVINTPTSNEPSGVPGVDTDFSGIIFQVNGKGVIELDCQTLGVDVLNVKVGSQEPTTISKNERGIIEVAYDVTEPTYVYVYATSARVGAPLRVSASENCVKLWSLTVKPGATLGISHTTATSPIGEEMYYTLDGRMVVNPTKGVYIYKGKKVVIK